MVVMVVGEIDGETLTTPHIESGSLVIIDFQVACGGLKSGIQKHAVCLA